MAHTRHPTEFHEQHVDDLKRIRGIGPIMEQRLNQAGILTFTQLASMSTENLAALFLDMPGLSAERIAEKGWIAQAQLLIEKEVTIDNPASDDNAQYSALFSVDLLLDSQNRVRRTHIVHVQSGHFQSGKEDSWADWNKERLAGFMLENAIIRSTETRTETVEIKPALKSQRENEKQAKAKEITGDLSISKVEIQAKSGKVTHWLVAENEPFAVGFILDMSKTSISPGTLLQYETEVYIKNLTGGKRRNIGENKGTIESKNLFPLVVNCHALPQGSYRLEAYAILSPDLENQNPRSRLIAMTEGTVFKVS